MGKKQYEHWADRQWERMPGIQGSFLLCADQIWLEF